MQARLSQCLQWVAGSVMSADTGFDGVSTDSRSAPAGSLFVALRGEHFDAHVFLTAVQARGVAAIVARRDTDPALLAHLSVPVLLVADTGLALGQIGSGWRRQFCVPVIGVTGSNGKTTVKEMIAAILVAEFGQAHCTATPGNFNNAIGVPLTLLQIGDHTRAAVIELGMNHPGEIAGLCALAQPTVALVNNAQREHQEFMASVEAVARENGTVISSLPDRGVAVFPADDLFTGLWRQCAARQQGCRSVTFGTTPAADVYGTYQANRFGSEIAVVAGTEQFQVTLHAAGGHNVRNALAAIACTLAIGVAVASVVQGLGAFVPVAGRLQGKRARSGALLIDDTYNANPDSVLAAIDVLAQSAPPRVLVLGDMGEVGTEGDAFHAEIGVYARTCGIEHLLTFGALAAASSRAFGTGARHYAELAALQQAVDVLATPVAAVLVKGSRFMKMERIVHHLLGQQVQDSH